MNKKTIKKYIESIDKKLEKALRPLPSLPRKVVAVLSDYLWVLTAIGAVLMVLGILSSFYAISAYLSFMGNMSAYAGIYMQPVYSPLWLVSSILSIGFSALIAYLYFIAVAPLREMKAYGWNLLLVAFLVAGVQVVVNALLSLNVFGFIFSILFAAIFYGIGAYLLYQVKPHFVKAHK